MPQQTNLPRILITILIAFLILYLGTTVASSVITLDQGSQDITNQPALLDGTNYVSLGDSVGTNERVVDSTGNAINTTGAADSYWQSTEDIEIASDDTWTVSLWLRVDPDATTRNMTALSVDGRILITYNSSGNWSAWYYDDGSTNSYQVNVSAPSPTNLTNVMLVRNNTNLTIYRNNTPGESANLTNTSTVAAPTGNENWDGRTDEVRSFDDPLTSSERQSLYDDPVSPLTNTNRTARIMFDKPDDTYQLLFFSDGRILTSNETYSKGLPGSVMDSGRFAALGADYQWDTTGPKIKAISGGELDGAPVAYASYTRESRLDSLADDWNTMVALAGTFFVLLPLGVILVYLRSVRRVR